MYDTVRYEASLGNKKRVRNNDAPSHDGSKYSMPLLQVRVITGTGVRVSTPAPDCIPAATAAAPT